MYVIAVVLSNILFFLPRSVVNLLSDGNFDETDLPLGNALQEILVIPSKIAGKLIGRGGEASVDDRFRLAVELAMNLTMRSFLLIQAK